MPTREHGQTVKSTTEARAAVTRQGGSRILVISTLAVIVLFAIIYFAFFAR
jgi:hypothetical protein